MESRTQKSTPAEIGALLRRLGIESSSVQNDNHIEDLEHSVLQSRFGVELWKYFLILALVVAIIELLFARSSKKESLPVPQHDRT